MCFVFTAQIHFIKWLMVSYSWSICFAHYCLQRLMRKWSDGQELDGHDEMDRLYCKYDQPDKGWSEISSLLRA